MKTEEIKRKIRIRNEAYQNMVGEEEGCFVMQMSEEEVQRSLKKLHEECLQIDEYACLKIYEQIYAKNRLVHFVKRALRKVCYKLMGWYYVPVIEGQIDYNRKSKQLLKESLQLLNMQQEEIIDLKKQIRKYNSEDI